MYWLIHLWFFYASLQSQPLNPSLESQPFTFSPNPFQLQNFKCYLPVPSIPPLQSQAFSWKPSLVTGLFHHFVGNHSAPTLQSQAVGSPQSQLFSFKFQFKAFGSNPSVSTLWSQLFSANPSPWVRKLQLQPACSFSPNLSVGSRQWQDFSSNPSVATCLLQPFRGTHLLLTLKFLSFSCKPSVAKLQSQAFSSKPLVATP